MNLKKKSWNESRTHNFPRKSLTAMVSSLISDSVLDTTQLISHFSASSCLTRSNMSLKIFSSWPKQIDLLTLLFYKYILIDISPIYPAIRPLVMCHFRTWPRHSRLSHFCHFVMMRHKNASWEMSSEIFRRFGEVVFLHFSTKKKCEKISNVKYYSVKIDCRVKVGHKNRKPMKSNLDHWSSPHREERWFWKTEPFVVRLLWRPVVSSGLPRLWPWEVSGTLWIKQSIFFS